MAILKKISGNTDLCHTFVVVHCFTKIFSWNARQLAMEAESANEELPLFPEEEWYEVLLRYGLYLGAAFQLICILAVLISPSSDIKDAEDNSCSSEDESDDDIAGSDVKTQHSRIKSRRLERKKRR